MYAVLNILPSILNIMSLFLLALYIFACVGINLFSGTKRRENIDDKNNFETFTGAMLVLMRFSTGEDWSDFMYEYATTDNCQVSNHSLKPFCYRQSKHLRNSPRVVLNYAEPQSATSSSSLSI